MIGASSTPHHPKPLANGTDHIEHLQQALAVLEAERLQAWGRELATRLQRGGRLLAAGNGGSAAEAQHLTSELVGRLRDDRQPLSAIALHAETSAVTAIGNDYGYDEVFARQVRAHGRPGDILLLLSTSGRSRNVLRAAEAAHERGLTVWALTGTVPNPLTELADEAVCADGPTATVQECHLVAVHILCASVDIALGVCPPVTPAAATPTAPGGLVVVGDALLDRDLLGMVDRVSPEAPVVVVDRVEVCSRPGGAGLAAVLAARSARPVTLVTALSDDREGRDLGGLLRDAGIRVLDLGLAGPTPVKSRVRADGRTVLMFSQAPEAVSGLRRALTDDEHALVVGASAVLVSDYGRGLTEDASVRAALAAAATATPMVWDPHPRGARPVPGARLVTPNRKEATGFAPGSAGTDLRSDIERGRQLIDIWKAAGVAVTRGADGALLLDTAKSSPLAVPGRRIVAADTCGAGDCFAASATALLAGGALLSEAVTGAVRAAEEFVAAGGATSWMAGTAAEEPGTEPADPLEVVARVRAAGGTVVATGGCFDLLHAGHIALLENARLLGDCLVVCLNDDDSVRRLKGPQRPIVTVGDRAAVLGSLASVDGVVVFAESTPEEALRRIRPDIYVKGGDYRVDDVPEAALVDGWGGRTVILPYVDGRSTTRMVDKILLGIGDK
ncbi:D-glycero-beta-D-manno-heptose 1-phosphate adenylyltransferase [Streptomyces sp. NPDC058240]|uniref:D-glycero-beta-D-manno-heptose 1-phosphate adenylyltransferase n=1 Tax=Streptomyces sp. NPDC058240 TaxID=3346396 RepID=UPI0036E20A09